MALRLSSERPEREPLLVVFEAALAAVDPEVAVRQALPDYEHGSMVVVAIGKAAPAMARGVPGSTTGLVITDTAGEVPRGCTLKLGSHPLPDVRSIEAARALLTLLESTSGPILFLISGGASSLCELPAEGVPVDQLAATTAALLRSGASIAELNCVRKHLSQLKGGRLAASLGHRPSRTLLISDVVGDDVATIGSGPTVADPTSFEDAIAILDRHQVEAPDAVMSHLALGAGGQVADTPSLIAGEHEVEVIANCATAAEAAAAAASERGIPARVATTELVGDAAAAAREAVNHLQPGMTFFAGETTVEVTGSGVGGRNQHAALSAAIEIAGNSHVTFGALATDGIDGATLAAGGIVDYGTVRRGQARGLDAARSLRNHDSHTFLAASGDVLWLGPSGTNVGDLWVTWTRD